MYNFGLHIYYRKQNKMDRKRVWLVAGIVVLALIILCGAGYLVMRTYKASTDKEQLRELQELAELNKREMENEYEDFARQYRELQQQVTNDSLVAQLEKEQQRAEALLEELQRTKDTDAAEILRLKKELATLREILKNYIIQIDSLNNLNQELTAENRNLRQENEQANEHISSLKTERETLAGTVAIAAQLNASNIRATAHNKKGKETAKAKDARSFQISFSIARNVTAQTGMKAVYVVITTPTGNVLSRGGTFPYENRNIKYSIRKDIEYTGEEYATTVYWDVNETLSTGNYRVDIFVDGQDIGNQSFSLQ